MSYGIVLFGPAEAAPDQDHWVGLLHDLADGPVRVIHAEWGWALRATTALAPELARQQVRAGLEQATPSQRAGVDAALVPPALVTAPPGLVVTDVDSTLTTTEAIDLLAARAGAGERVAAITERAMRGELDFAASLTERVATLQGLPVAVLDEVMSQVKLSAGAGELVAAVHRWGGRVGVVSGGFTPLVSPLASQLALDAHLANDLEVNDGVLTGRVSGQIVDAEVKRVTLTGWAQRWDVPLSGTVAIGDGANDLPMLHAAGLGIAYCAKPLVVEQAPASVGFARLDGALALIAPWQ